MSKVFESLQHLESSAGLGADFGEIRELLRSAPPSQMRFSVPVEEGAEAPATVVQQPSVSDGQPQELEYEPEVPQLNFRVMPIRVTADSPLFPFDHQSHPKVAEQYRIIRTNIVQHPMSHRVIAVCSVGPGDGKTLTSINVAAAMSLKSDTKVLFIEGDLRRGSVANKLGTAESPGLTDYLAGAASLSDVIVQAEQLPNLHILVAGTRPTNPGEVLDSQNWRRLIDQVRRLYDYVIVDTPPLGLVADCDLIQAVCDGVILVARVDHSARSLCTKALANIPQEKLLGVVLNWIDEPFFQRHHDSYGYQPIQPK